MSDKELTIDGLKKLWNILLRLEREQFMDCVNDARELLERSEPVRHGHWILPDICYEDIECSVCHVDMPLPISFDYRPMYKYCPMCGAKMDEVSK